jgi:hypothetical protein
MPKDKLTAQDVMSELAKHEAECNLRYKRIEERLDDQKSHLKALDTRMWGLAALIIGAAIVQELF